MVSAPPYVHQEVRKIITAIEAYEEEKDAPTGAKDFNMLHQRYREMIKAKDSLKEMFEP